MIDRNDFIIKKGRKFFKAHCDKCGSYRGYRTPDHDCRPCVRCNTKRANLFSQKSRKSTSKSKCTLSGCQKPHHGKGLCEHHYNIYIRKNKETLKEIKVKQCDHCGQAFECKSLKAKFCSLKCKAFVHRQKHLELVKIRNKNWQQNNRDKISLYRSRPNIKIAAHLRSRISRAVKNNYKIGSAVKDLDCSIEELKIYLESKFLPGMTWDNYGLKGWHIDHIRPLISFDLTDMDQFKEACHYTNLQPLWAQDNLKKSDNYEA